MKLNEQIAYLRRQKGMTQEQLANALGVTNQSVSKWESGQNCPDIQLLPELARLFDVTIDSLMGYSREDSLSDTLLRVRQHLSATPADKAFESCYKLAALLHEAVLTYGYSADARWNTDRDYAAEAMDKWGLSLMNDGETGCSGRSSRGIFFALPTGEDVPDRYRLKRTAEELRKLADPNALRVMFELYRRGKDEYASVRELCEITGLDETEVVRALDDIQAEQCPEGFRLDERLRHIPALMSFIMPV